jgi:hypothetical protein
MTRKLAVLAAAAALWAASPARAAVPQVLTYTGYLKTAAGAPVTAATNLTFAFYGQPSGGTALASQTLSVLPSPDGWVSVLLSPSPLPSFAQELYLGVTVESELELAPRARVTPAPSALAVDWSAVQSRPQSCPAGQFLTVDGTGALGCATPAGASGGSLTSVVGAGFLATSNPTGPTVTVSLSGCPSAGQALQWNGTAWACVATVTSLGVLAPLSNSGTAAAPVLKITQANAGQDGYLSSADWTAFNAKLGAPAVACGVGQVLKWTGALFACQADDVGIGSISVSDPLVSSGGVAPLLSLKPVGAAQNGYLTAGDWAIFNAKVGSFTVTGPMTATASGGVARLALSPVSAGGDGYLTSADYGLFSSKMSPPTAACASGEVLTWAATGAACVADANTTYAAGPGLVLSNSQFGAAYAGAGGNLGTSASLARSDHAHPIHLAVPLASLRPTGATNALVAMGSFVQIPALEGSFASGFTFEGTVVIPGPGAPVLKVVIRNATAASATYSFAAGYSGVAAASALPTTRFASGSVTLPIAAGQTGTAAFALSTSVAGATATAGVGDLLWFQFQNIGTGNPLFDVVGVELVF